MRPLQLRAELYGHSKDVRGVTEGPIENSILSGSRDGTVRIWEADESGQYNEKCRLSGHDGFVTSVASARPSSTFVNGLVFSGGQDKKINVYEGGKSPSVVCSLEGHTAAVCSLAFDEETQSLVSGSWDSTARVWKGQECVAVLAGHSHTVWAVAIVPSATTGGKKSSIPRVLTGSADKKIILWADGKQEHVYEGHTDCVRALAVISDTEFLSAANDSTIRRWNLYTGECLMTYIGHENFIYSMSVSPNDQDMLVTTAEDGTAKVWKISTGDNVQTVLFPTQTIWTVRCLRNGDVVAGSSDGIIRIFSSDSKRQAAPDLVAAYDLTVQTFLNSMNNKDEIGGIKVTDLPGAEALNEPGKKDGQTKMVRTGQGVELYNWIAETQKWEKVGDVMGTAKPADGKSWYQGKQYDYVFDVDIEDGKPPLKLPYNADEDPWMAAHKFLETNMLPPAYIDQVVQFILRNAPNAGRGAPAAVFSDPFTGSGRYMPQGNSNSTNSSGGADPFTGGGRYVPGSVSNSTFAPPPDVKALDPKRPRGDNMPLMEPIIFSSVSADSLLAKLIEFNKKQSDAAYHLSDDQILLLEEFTRGGKGVQATDAHFKALERALLWPKDYLVPVLDIFRLAILNKSVNAHFFDNSKRDRGFETVDYLCRLIPSVDSSPQFQILVCRSFANAIGGGDHGGRLLIGRECSTAIIPLVCQCLDSPKASAQVAAASALANLSSAYLSSSMRGVDPKVTTAKLESFRSVIEKLKASRGGIDYGSLDQEAILRILQAVVTMMWGDDATLAVARAMKMEEMMAKLKDATNDEKSKAIARSIERMLSL